MARLTWLPDALREEGLRVTTVAGWRTRGSDSFAPRGVMFHHTASASTGGDCPALHIVTHGRSDLPGPLCNVLVCRDGSVKVIASGKANHAGTGGPWRTIPRDAGNTYLAGVEVENSGVGEPWSNTVLAACDRVFAAILKRLGKDHTWCVGHKEWTTRKIDPSLSMDAYRRRLRDYMEGSDEMTDREKAQLAEALEKARALTQYVEGMTRRLQGDTEPPNPGERRRGWRHANRFLTEPDPSVPSGVAPHSHRHTHTVSVEG